MKILRRTQFGNPVLRQVARRLSDEEILSDEIQGLIADMYFTVDNKPFGVGLAAPQIGQSVAISTIAVKPTPTRPDREPQRLTVINPEIVKTYGKRTGMWEGCVSFGGTKDFPYAKAMRYRKVRVRYQDERAKVHEADFDGFLAHVLQHETDHLNGVLFVDRVADNTTFITSHEYKKQYGRPKKPLRSA